MRAKISLSILVFVFISQFTFSQSFQETAPDKYLIFFTDKENNSYSIERPEEFLSERAIERRIKQNIPIVENDLPVSPNYIDSLKNVGVKILNTSKWLNTATIETYSQQDLNEIANLTFVKSQLISKNEFAENIEHQTSNLQSLSNKLDYGFSGNQIEMLNGHILHNNGFQGEGMVIAVIDAGFNDVYNLPAFKSLFANNQILGFKNFVNRNDSDVIIHTHGMSVLSTIGGDIPGELIGTAPKSEFWLLISEDGESEYVIEEDNWIAAAEFADSAGVDVINTSLGYSTFDDSSQNHTYKDMDGNSTRISIAANIAASKGMVVVTSAGNSGSSSWKYITAPADADSVLTVGAVDAEGFYATFSSQGPSYDGRVKPNIVAQGKGTIVQSLSNGIVPGNGTSFSAPVISGMVACLWQANPDKTNMEILRAIEKSADQYQNPDGFKGYGIPDFAYANLLLKGIDYNLFEQNNLVKAYPSPFEESLTVEFYSYEKQEVVVDIVDIYGRQVFLCDIVLGETLYHTMLIENLAALTSGVYILRVHSAKESHQIKLLKQ